MADDLFVRLDADIVPLERSLSAAQRALSRQTAFIKAASREEIEVARAALREKEALFKHGVDVNLRAARLEYAQRVELARAGASAQIRALRSTNEQIAKSAPQSIGALRGLNESFLSLTRSVTGMPPVLGRMTDVLGTFALGAGPTVAVIGGITAIAVAFSKITEESREAKEQLQNLNDELEKLRQQQANPAGIPIIAPGRINLDQLRRQLEDAQRGTTVVQRGGGIETIVDRGRVAELRKEIAEQEARIRAGENRITEIVTEGQKKRANEIKKGADDAIAEHRRMYAEIEAIARANEAHRQLFFPEGIGRSDPLAGFEFPDHLKGADNALDDLRNTVEKLNRELGMVPVGSTAPEGPGFFGRMGGRFKDLLNPEMIVSGLATGFLSQGISLAVDGISKVIGSFFGLGDAADEAARRLQAAVDNIRLQTARMRGDTDLANFLEARSEVLGQLEHLGVDAPAVRAAKNLEELLAALQAIPNIPFFDDENIQAVIDWLIAKMETLGDQFDRLADSVRNIPQGYKIAFAQFSATTPSPAMAGAVGVRPVVINIDNVNASNPREFLDKVEQAAVQKLRSGGVLAWDLDV